MEELAAEAEAAAGDAVQRDLRSPDGRSPRGGRGSGACGPSPASGAGGSSRRAAPRARSASRRARSARPPTAMRPTSLRSRPIGASIVPGARADAAHERDVLALDLAGAHLLPQRRVGLVATREHEQARGVAFEPVDRRPAAARRRPRAGRVAQRRHERRPDDSRRRVRDDTRGLVGDDHVLVAERERDLQLEPASGPAGRLSASSSSSISSPPARRSALCVGQLLVPLARRPARRPAAGPRHATAGRRAAAR